uniref:Uncharacterized protein n=1 Tax=Trichobilharzia regenti TaxID=157069 RepID=A0AA85IX94_TRIRE|nr:unnamed protein product [Trichobilharzia regenti]
MAIVSKVGIIFPLGWQEYTAIACVVLILVFSILLCCEIKHSVIIGLIMTGIMIGLCSAIIYHLCCKKSLTNCYFLLGFIILEDLLTFILCILTRRFKRAVFIVFILLSVAFVITGGLLLFFVGDDELWVSLAGGFFNTAIDVAALCLVSSLKFVK